MTVGELLEWLSHLPKDAVIMLPDYSGYSRPWSYDPVDVSEIEYFPQVNEVRFK